MGAQLPILQNRFIPSDFLPIGFVGFWIGAVPPAGWMEINGQKFNPIEYPELYSNLGNKDYLPDLRGEFIRCWDNGRGVDAARTLLSQQMDEFRAHMHSVATVSTGTVGNAPTAASGSTTTNGSILTGSAGGVETRPRNISLMPVIKAKNVYYDLSIEGGNAYMLGGHPASYYVNQGQIQQTMIDLGSAVTGGYKNKLINGNFDIWQRNNGTSVAGYTADRWYMNFVSGSLSSSQHLSNAGDFAMLPVTNPKYGNVMTGTSVVGGYLSQTVERGASMLQGKTVTLSFYYYTISGSNTGGVPYLRLNYGTGGSANVNINPTTASFTTMPQTPDGYRRASFTFNIPTMAGKTLGTDDFLLVVIPFAGTFSVSTWGFQLEEGSVATAFEQRHVATELMLCQRYYQNPSPQQVVGQCFGATLAGLNMQYAVPMRKVPTFVWYLLGTLCNNVGVAIGVGNIQFVSGNTLWAYLYASVGSGLSAGQITLWSSYSVGLDADYY